MADVRPFRALRYTSRVDPSLAIAPPYDVISPAEQVALYDRSPYNVVRIEYGVQHERDTPTDNRYTRAAADLASWRAKGVLALDAAPAVYPYFEDFEWAGERYERLAMFVAVRLEPWDAGVVLPHERTLSNPKADRLDLLRATRTQISPVYGLVRAPLSDLSAEREPLLDVFADGEHHNLYAARDKRVIDAIADRLRSEPIYIADGHHRYETALAYRDEIRAAAASWTGDEPENFVLMALTSHDDPGLLVLPTHRVVHRASPADAMERLSRAFSIDDAASVEAATQRIVSASADRHSAFVTIGLDGRTLVLTLKDRAAVEVLMPAHESPAWKRLDVNVLQFGVLQAVFGIDEAALAAGGAVTYTQEATEAQRAVEAGEAACAFLLTATPVEQVLAVSDANGRMPQKSTYFYPKLPTGLVMRAFE